MKEKHLPMFSKNFIKENNFIKHLEYPNIQLTVYRNKTHILGIDDNNTFGSIHLIRGKKKFDQILSIIKDNFTSHFERNNTDNILTDERKRQIQEEKIENFLSK